MFETATIVKKKEVVTGKFPAATKSLAILDKFEGQERFGAEREQRKVGKNETVEQMMGAFRKFMKRDWENQESTHGFNAASRQLKSHPIPCSAGDIRLFSLKLAQFEHMRGFADAAGFFLSALMVESRHRKFVVDVGHLSARINNLGYGNIGEMTVNGNVGKRTGVWMTAGKIVVNGDAGEDTGFCAMGERITVNGNMEPLPTFIGNIDIFQYDRLLVKKGNPVAEPENK